MSTRRFNWNKHYYVLLKQNIPVRYIKLLQHVQRRYKAANDVTVGGRVSTLHLLVELNVPIVIAKKIVQVTEQDIMDYLLQYLFPRCNIHPDAMSLKHIEDQEKLYLSRLVVLENEQSTND